MRSHAFIVILVLALLCNKTRAGGDKLGEENKRKVEKIAKKILRLTIKEDLMTLWTHHNNTVEQVMDIVNKTLNYVDTNIEELKVHLETRIDESDSTTMNNLKMLENNTASMMAMINDTLMINLENINMQSMEERNDIISWIHERAHLHENNLKTRITACAHDYGHFGEGVVSYNSNDGGFIKQSVSIRVFNNTNIREEDVLNLETGIFKVPENASGEYVFTFTVTIDSFDQKLMPSCYFFALNGVQIAGTEIFANVGTSRIHDRVPGSRQIFLKLKEKDEISVIQKCKTDISDFQVSFCGALLHLERASDSPGGIFADSTALHFPFSSLAVQQSWDYHFLGFDNVSHVGYRGDGKENKPPYHDILEEAKILQEDWKTENADWTV